MRRGAGSGPAAASGPAVALGLGLGAGLLLVPAAMAVLLGRRRIRVTVVGGSMAPALAPGRTVVARRGVTGRLRTGQVVVLLKPTAPDAWEWPRPTGRPHRQPLLVKRLAALPGDPLPPGVPGRRDGETTVPSGHAAVLGDNTAASVDSRVFGLVPLDRIVAYVPGHDARHGSGGPGARQGREGAGDRFGTHDA
ncbi:S26 family signal peptidase [Streptomyces filamentosus]|uniref:S26 family signal peptidase n=1 Tax=Streptomyces filamentosus TaxID=67294 RepID=UPI0036EA2BB8